MDLFAELEQIKHPPQVSAESPEPRDVGLSMSEIHAIAESAHTRGRREGITLGRNGMQAEVDSVRSWAVDRTMMAAAAWIAPVLHTALGVLNDDVPAAEERAQAIIAKLLEIYTALDPLASEFTRSRSAVEALQDRISGFPRVG